MSKRSASPFSALEPPSKRLHANNGRHVDFRPPSFDHTLVDELILYIFTHLGYQDLCTVEAVNSNWRRLALDNELWKALFLREFGRGRMRGLGGYTIEAHPERETRPLPGRAKADPSAKDWKWLFRINSNWRTGRCAVEDLDYRDLKSQSPGLAHILLGGSLTVTARGAPSHRPAVVLHSRGKQRTELTSVELLPHPANAITCLAYNQSAPAPHGSSSSHLAVFYSTGAFSIFSLAPEVREVRHHNPIPGRTRPRTPITHAAFNFPLLISLSASFTLSIYHLSAEMQPTLRQSLTSFTSFPPASLTLSCPPNGNYRLMVSNSVPVYPVHWSLSVTELSLTPSGHVLSSSTVRAFDDAAWAVDSDDPPSLARRIGWGRKVAEVRCTETDGKFVVLASGTEIQVYRLRQNPSRLSYLRTLSTTGDVITGAALADGRCVVRTRGGAVWVWDLSLGFGAEVGQSSGTVSDSARVVFDERRILISSDDGVEVRRFDI